MKLNLTIRPEVPDGVDPDRERFGQEAFLFGLDVDDYHRVFRHAGKSYLLSGLKPNNRRYPVIGLCPRTGKLYKFEYSVLETLEGR